MADRFQLFRLTLLVREQIDAFAAPESREDFLRRVFSTDYRFKHYGISSTINPLPT